MKRQRAVYAEEPVLAAYGAQKHVEDEKDHLLYKSWKFTSRHCKMCNSGDLVTLARRIESSLESSPVSADDSDNVMIGDQQLRLPPMIFLTDLFSMDQVGSTVKIFLDAGDALTSWAAQHSPEREVLQPLKLIQVPYAKLWSARSLGSELGADSELEKTCDDNQLSVSTVRRWDWTFSTDYNCTLADTHSKTACILSAKMVSEGSIDSPLDVSQSLSGKFRIIRSNLSSEEDETTKSMDGSLFHQAWSLERAAVSGIKIEMLKATDMPILFYDEVVLYQVVP